MLGTCVRGVRGVASSTAATCMRGVRAASTVQGVVAREIIDSRGNPTLEVDVTTQQGMFRASVPSGASTGVHEAVELRDGGERYLGKGVLKAKSNVNVDIANLINGMDVTAQGDIDAAMIEADGTPNKAKFGANAILGVSLAVAKAGAAAKGVQLYRHLGDLAGNENPVKLPVPCLNVINGGSHAGNALPFQEFMILPTGASSFEEAMIIGCEVYHTLKDVIKSQFGQDAINVGDEGGFAPNIDSITTGLDLLMDGIDKAGYAGQVKIALDAAASEFFTADGQYDLNFKESTPNTITRQQLADLYMEMVDKYPIVSIEDPFDQDDWEGWSGLTSSMGSRAQIVGDDLLVTNPTRIAEAGERGACNALLLKVNQIGSVTESIQAWSDSTSKGWNTMVSHRSGETEDNYIADLVVALGTGQIKTGAPCRSERNAKYNQLLRIAEDIRDRGLQVEYAGADAFRV